MTQVDMDVNIELPPTVFVLANEVARHGIFHMFVPPVNVIRKWIDKDKELNISKFTSEDEEEAFLEYMCNLIPPSMLNLLVADDALHDDEIDDDDVVNDDDVGDDDVHDVHETETVRLIASLSQGLVDMLMQTLLDRLLPLYIKKRDDEKEHGKDSSIVESIEHELTPRRSAKDPDMKEAIKEYIFDLLVGIKRHLESDSLKKLLEKLDEGDEEHVEEHAILDEMMERHYYESHALKDAVARLVPVFEVILDPLMKDICLVFQRGFATGIQDMLVKERENIPGPQHLE